MHCHFCISLFSLFQMKLEIKEAKEVEKNSFLVLYFKK
jgi:hypothetical protein